MTKLQLLHRALNERLMAAVEQIMGMVGGTVLEYEVETVRARKENEALRRRLRWLEGEIPTDLPDIEIDTSGIEQPVIVNDTSGFKQPFTVEDEPVRNCPSIKIEPINVSDLQSLIPDTSLAAAVSVRSADLEIVRPGTTEATHFGISNSMDLDSFHSYMAPLDCDPTVLVRSKERGRGRSRSKRMSFACPDCGKVFGREQRLLFHMRAHSADRPYTHRRRKTRFYGDKKRKKRLRGLCKVYPSKEFVEDDSDTGESTGPATVSAPVGKQNEKEGNDKMNKTTRKMKTQEHPKKPVIRTSVAEVESARAGGHPLLQCSECKETFARADWLAFHLKSHKQERALAHKEQKKKQLLSNKPEKNVSNVSTRAKKNPKMVAEKGSPLASKKILKCSHCDKVFTHKGWLASHIRSHMNKSTSSQSVDILNILPTSARRKRKAIAQLPNEEEIRTKQSNVRTDDSKTGSELQAKIVEPNKMNVESKLESNSEPKSDSKSQSKSESILESKLESKSESVLESKLESILESKPESISVSKSKSRRKKKKSKRRKGVSSEIAEESTKNPEDSTEDAGGVQRPRQTYSCRECGKVYVMAGCLTNHIRGHMAERLRKKREKQEQQMLKRIIGEEVKMKELAEAKKLLEKQNSINIRKTENQDTSAVLPELSEDKSSDVQAAEVRGPFGRKRYKCSHCNKTYTRKNYLDLHMVCHNKTLVDETQKSDDVQESSSTVDSTIQNGQDGGKGLFPCPVCNKVFRRGMQLMVHMQIHSCEKPYSYRERKEQFHGDLTRPRVPDSSSQEPAIEISDGNGGFAVTGSHAAVSQDHANSAEPMESIEPQSVCSDRKFNLLHQQSSGATSSCITNQARFDSKLNSRTTCHFRLQPRIVLQPLNVKSKTCTLPGEHGLGLVKAETGPHVPKNSSQSDSQAKQRVADAHPVCVTFSDVDSEDDNDFSDVVYSLDEEIALHQIAPEKLADMETADSSHPKSSPKGLIPKRNKTHGIHDNPLANRDEMVATSVQDTGKHSGSTCMICGLKFAEKASLSLHMQTHSSVEHAKTSCNRIMNNETRVKQPVGREQTSDAQEASTNIPEIPEEMAVIEEKTSQSSGHHPDIDTSTRSKGGRKSKQYSRIERKVLHCHLCGKACRKIELHLKYDHPREPEVIEAFKFGQNSEERKRLLSSLCSLKSSESDKNDAALKEDLVHCLFCQGSYQRNQFWRHALVCEQKKGEKGSEAVNSVCAAKHSPENRPSKAQKTKDQECKNQVKDTTSNTTLVKAPMPEVDPSTVQKSVASPSTVPEIGGTDITIHADSKSSFLPVLADPRSDHSSLDTSIACVQKTDLITAKPSIHITDRSKPKTPDLKSGSSPVQDCVQSEHTQQPQDAGTDTSHTSEDIGTNGEDTGSDLGLRIGSGCTTVVKRKFDSQDSEFTEAKTKKKRQRDPSQVKPTRVYPINNLSDETDVSQTTRTDKEASGCSTGNG